MINAWKKAVDACFDYEDDLGRERSIKERNGLTMDLVYGILKDLLTGFYYF